MAKTTLGAVNQTRYVLCQSNRGRWHIAMYDEPGQLYVVVQLRCVTWLCTMNKQSPLTSMTMLTAEARAAKIATRTVRDNILTREFCHSQYSSACMSVESIDG